MKAFKEYLREARFKYANQFDLIDAVLSNVDARTRKVYIDRMNAFSKNQMNDVENSMENVSTEYMNATYSKGNYDEDKEIELMTNAMDATISEIFYG